MATQFGADVQFSSVVNERLCAHMQRADVADDGTERPPGLSFPFYAARPRAATGARIPPSRRGPRMKEELMTLEGRIDEILPDGRFGVTLDNAHRIIAYTAGRMRRFRIRSIVGDRVHVEMSGYDLSIGRIVFREKIEGQSPGRRGFFRKRR